ncbi:hypothetical protein ARMGADRAFT_1032079 [Armillaria gallica]|uniref:Uncharacterized protein n=1 Tax=Armillaria gallica TaxID=47427 RepID=A0A2H3DRU6_ARMGA|nr:hypothetical protein ARMGADRAFT_1032079 [Armillaria gallica]
MVLGQLQAIIDKTTALFDEHHTLLGTVERVLRELRAETYMLTAGHLDTYRHVLITNVRSWMVYASKVKDTWKKACEYCKRITDLKTEIELKLLEDAEANEQAALRQILFGLVFALAHDIYLEQKADIQHFEDINEKERLSSWGRERREASGNYAGLMHLAVCPLISMQPHSLSGIPQSSGTSSMWTFMAVALNKEPTVKGAEKRLLDAWNI